MNSKPIDLYCPVQAVSYQKFSRLFRKLEHGDRYCHPGYLEHQHTYALWNWDLGVFWSSPTTDLLGEVLVHAIRYHPTLGEEFMGRPS